uniref:RNA-dependent RNA polymerase n=1 Tax=Tanacetum cinerariifolium TaxID=118510 RepID=A0A699HCW7_TANCI|nr:probable RNA-dependent RNA polymerase 5 [Tanacetum cinerariifolium]
MLNTTFYSSFYTRKPRKANLSKNLIALLTVGGVPKEYFMTLLNKTLQEAQNVSLIGLNYGQMNDNTTSVEMIGSGIPMDKPYLQHCMSMLTNKEWKGLRGGKIPVDDSFYLIGTADPTKTLECDEVCVILYPAMEEFVGDTKYGIFFSTKGRRSMGSEITNGDFDGDLYCVSQTAAFLDHFKVSKPWERTYFTPSALSKKPSELSHDELEKELVTQIFATQRQNMVVGKSTNSFLTFADQYIVLRKDDAEKHRLEEKMLKLTGLYYDALDAGKSRKTVVEFDIVILSLSEMHAFWGN